MKFLKLYIVLAFLFLFACEKRILVDNYAVRTQYVVNSIFQPDSVFEVHLSQSGKVFGVENLSKDIDDAHVELYGNNDHLETLLPIGNGLYKTNIEKAKEEVVYKIVVLSFGQTIEGEDRIPVKSKLLKSELITNAGYNSLKYRYHSINLTFNDDPEVSNYYEILLKFEYLDSIPFLGQYRGISNVYSYDPVIKNEIDIKEYGFNLSSLVFSDELFNGKEYKLPIDFYNIGGDDMNIPFKLIVQFSTISKNYYSYKKKLYLYREFELNDIWEDLREPVVLFSNIENGYGIFAGINVEMDTLYSVGQ